ncbi:hypothetical protein [Mesobacillus thioparans]
MEKERDNLNKMESGNELEHSMVCNDQLFFQELRIAAEDAERDRFEEGEK